MMKKKSLFYRLTLGLLLGALIMPSQPAQAQFGGFVHDVKNYVVQLKKRADDARHHAEKFDNAVKQLTTLRGVLGKAEELVTNQLISKQTMSDIGMTVRASFDLKDQLEAIITTRLTMLKSIDDRLRSGIFDPEADMRDLEDYLRTSIGRSSQDSLANLDRLRKMDNTLERLNNELQKAQAELARTRKKRKDLNTLLIKEEDKSVDKRSAESIASLNEQIYDCDALILQCNTKIEDLRSKIEAHTKKFYAMMDERIKFGEEVDATNKGWSEFDDALDGIQRALSGY